MTASIDIGMTAHVQYVLRIADTCLVHAQRLAEWCGHAPVIEEDIALANVALDHLGQARALLTHAGTLDGHALDEDRLAFLRDERDFRNLTLVELPLRKGGGDFADTVLRVFLVAAWLRPLWEGLQRSADETLAGIAGKAVKEARYHVRHGADWVVRLGDGTDVSASRMQAALARAWPFTSELFADDAVDAHAQAEGLGPPRSALRAAWDAEVATTLAHARLPVPAATPYVATGTQGRHSEHLGPLLAEMQVLQRSFPGGRW